MPNGALLKGRKRQSAGTGWACNVLSSLDLGVSAGPPALKCSNPAMMIELLISSLAFL